MLCCGVSFIIHHQGGGIDIHDGFVTCVGSYFTNNSATSDGNDVYISSSGSLTTEGSTNCETSVGYLAVASDDGGGGYQDDDTTYGNYNCGGTSPPTMTPLPMMTPTTLPTVSPRPTSPPSYVPSLRPVPVPTALPVPKPTATPTAVPTSAPTFAPTPTPWYDTNLQYLPYAGAFVFGAGVAGAVSWLFSARVGRRPPLARIMACFMSAASVVTDAAYCYSSATSAQFCYFCPNSDAPLVIFLNLLFCGTLLAVAVRRLQLALDGEATLSRLSFYVPLLLLVAHDGSLIVWLPWTETEATLKLDGFPDIPAVEFTSWCIAIRKLPIFALQTRELWYLQDGASPLNVGCALLSGLNLVRALVHRGLQVLALRRLDVDVAIVSVDRVRDGSNFDDEFRGAQQGSSGPGFSLVAGATGGAVAADQGDFEQGLRNPLLSSDSSGAVEESGGMLVGASSEGASGPSSVSPPRRPFVGSHRRNNRYTRLQGLLLSLIGAGMPLLIFFNKLPSDELVERIIVWVILCFLGLIIFSALVACVVGGSVHVGKRKIVRQSFLEEREEEIKRQRTEAERQREEVQRRDERAEYIDRQLDARGISVEEYYRLSEAKSGYEAAFQRYIGGDESAEADVAKWSNVLSAHPERIKEIEQENQAWAAREMPRCREALDITRTFVPTDVRRWALGDLMSAGLPRPLAQRVLQKKQLWLCVMHPDDVARLHKAELLNKYAVTGCDIVELRSIFAKLPPVFINDPDGDKEAWRRGVWDKLKEMTVKEENGTLTSNEARNRAYRAGRVSSGGSVVAGPFNPREPLIRHETVKSSAFDPTPQPFAGGEVASSARVGDLRAKLLGEAQQRQQKEGGRGAAQPAAAPPSRDFVKSRAEGLANALAKRGSSGGGVGGGEAEERA